MPLPTIEVNLSELLGEEGEPISLRDDIVNQAAKALVEKLYRELADTIKPSIEKEVKARVAERISTVFETQLFDTDRWGSKRSGPPRTMAEIVLEETMKYLKDKVGKDGREDYGERNIERLHYFAMAAAHDIVAKELAPSVEKAKKEIKEQVGHKLADAFKAALKDAASCFC